MSGETVGVGLIGTSWIARAFWRLPTDPKGAVADYDAALAKNPRSPDALRSKAAVLADHLHQPKEAVAALDKVLELYPTYTEARAGRAVYLARTGDAKRATAWCSRCARSSRSSKQAVSRKPCSVFDPPGPHV